MKGLLANLLIDLSTQVGDRESAGKMIQNKFQLKITVVILQKFYSLKKKEVGWLSTWLISSYEQGRR